MKLQAPPEEVEGSRFYLNYLRARRIFFILLDNLKLTRTNLELAHVRQTTGAAGQEEALRWEVEIAKRIEEGEKEVINAVLDSPLTIKEIASLCGVNPRTAYRDVQALESVLGLPIWEEGKKRGIVEGYFLPPVAFSLPEATVMSSVPTLLETLRMLYDAAVVVS
jgi:hypothetical protein